MSDCHSVSVPVSTVSTVPLAAPSRPTAREQRLTLALVAIGMFMAVLDSTIVNVALPAMRTSLGATVAELAWIVDAYTLSFAALILAGGALSDRFGAKRVYLAGLALFVGASAACGVASSVALLVAARFAQGMGAALFLPASLAIVRSTFDVPAERARAIAVWAGIASVAVAVGPVLGGILVDDFGWRSAFLINVPTGAVAFAGAAALVRAAAAREVRQFDWAGQCVGAAALGALCFAVIELPTRGAGAMEVRCALLIAGLAAVVLVAVERRARHPMVPLAWFRNRVFVAMNLMGSLVYVGYFGLLFVLSLYLHGRFGMSARQIGLTLLPFALSLSLGNLLSGKLHGRVRPVTLMANGLAMAALAVPAIALALALRAPWPVVWAAMAAFGTGTALSVAPMIATVLEQVPADAAGVASGFLNAARQAGSLLGVAIAGAATILLPDLTDALWAVAALGGVAYAIAALAARAAGRAETAQRGR
ncbi:MFS transporter [Burkholderia cenocepacia]|uniref:MFS transporter n=1 Tax=Burkholderia cenocepacia TaxID=95486 RepID=UPI000F55B5DA|nr:MFS transporter [Burkholderia cenocepacia]RQV40430.1 MFS transporter [Burkholderia cenocepacia]RQV43366.1 MFS transporter [Burkholderia cenocepacia]RQV84014.1 MFS transporter [Burkholderia cenocepacia]